MIQNLATVQIEDLPRFNFVFSTQGATARRKHGSVRSQVFTVQDQTSQVRGPFAWSGREAFDALLNDASVRLMMQASGTIGRPDFVFLGACADLPG